MYIVNRYETAMRKSTGERIVDIDAGTGDVALWGPNCVPHIVRMAAIALNADVSNAGVVKFDLRPTTGSDTSRTDGTVATINIPVTTAFTAGSAQPVYYHVPSSPVTVYPGQEVVAEVTDTAAGATGVSITLWVEAIYEVPANVIGLSGSTTMTATT